jgi:hypothetical protein
MKFISFGCWNKGDPENSEYPIYHLLDKLDYFLHDNDVDFIVITGDNYYSNIKKNPDTEYTLDEIKQHPKNVENLYEFQDFKQVTNHIIEGGGKKAYCNLEHLEFVFNELNRISDEHEIPIYMCSGNHEYKRHTFFMPKKEDSPPIERLMNPYEYGVHNLLDVEKELFNCNRCTFIESGRLIEGLPFFVINTEEDKIDTNDNILKIINQSTGKIYIFGHIPILSLKKKKGKHMVVNEYLIDLFCRLKDGINVSYICADTHSYQDITITFENGTIVNQVILGTGGTFQLDDITDNKTELNSITLPDKIKYIKIKEATTGIHGFGLFDTGVGSDFEPSHKFIGFGGVEVGGYKPKNTKNKKYKKRKTKRRSNKRKTNKRKTNKRKTKKRKNNK